MLLALLLIKTFKNLKMKYQKRKKLQGMQFLKYEALYL